MSTHDPSDLRGQERIREERESQRRIEDDLEDKDWKWLMASPKGRRIVWRLLVSAGVFHPSFNTNAMQMAFNEGNRNYGNKLLATVMRLCPELYPTMVREQSNARSGDGNSAKSN